MEFEMRRAARNSRGLFVFWEQVAADGVLKHTLPDGAEADGFSGGFASEEAEVAFAGGESFGLGEGLLDGFLFADEGPEGLIDLA